MHTLTLNINDNFYNQFLLFLNQHKQNVNVLEDVVDDGYPSISFAEAQKRVKTAVEDYKNGQATLLNQEEYDKEMSKFIQTL